jgi:putative FmdB family regulatory protein
MPTYPYQCQNCGNEFDQYQKFTDAPLTKCPKCKKNKLQRVVVPSAIVFKGSGWYKTDSRSKAPAAAKNGSKTAEAAGETATAEKPAETAAADSNGDGKAAKPKKEAPAAKADD